MIDEPLRSWVATDMTFLKPLDDISRTRMKR
jgi:hypothetical protein